MQILFIMIIGKFTLPQTKILHACSQQKVVQVSKVLVAIFNSWRNGFFSTNQCSSNCNHVKKKCGFFLAGSSKCHSIMRRMFISSTFQKSYSKTVYFREILLRFFYWVSTWLVYTLIQLNSPWKGENCLKRITLLGSERKSVSTFLCLFFEREGQWDIFTWFCLLKLVTKLAPVFCGVETRDDCISGLLL